MKDNLRNTKPTAEGPFFWVSKAADERLGTHHEISNRTHARAVYWALVRIASDRQSPQFQIHKSVIAEACGLCKRTVSTVLYQLEYAGLIRITRKKVKTTAYEVNTYSLLTVKSHAQYARGRARNAQGDAEYAEGSSAQYAQGRARIPHAQHARNQNKNLSPSERERLRRPSKPECAEGAPGSAIKSMPPAPAVNFAELRQRINGSHE